MIAIVLIAIVIALSFVLFIALRKMVDSVNNDNQEYYFKKVQELDKEISEKKQQLDELLKKENVNEDKDKEGIDNTDESSFNQDVLDLMNSSDYVGDNALEIAQKVDEIFDINEEEIIKKFIKNMKFDDNYEFLVSINDRFSPNLIYKLKNLNKDMQINEIKKMLNDDEYKIFNDYLKTHNFKLDKFLLDLRVLMDNLKPDIEVMVGNKNKNYNYLSPYIKTIYSKDIYKGIIIKFQNRIYDYSINERDV